MQNMDKKKESKKGIDSHNFMDKLFTKLKMTKHSGEEKTTGKKLKDSDSYTIGESKPFIFWDKSKVTPDNIMEFSDQLQELLDYVQNLKDVVFYTYEYPKVITDLKSELTKTHFSKSPELLALKKHTDTNNLKICVTFIYSKLNDRLQKEAIELRNLFRDVRAAAIDIERLKKQRYLIKKEKCVALKKLDKLKEDEISELESIICAYAKPLHTKWESIKNSQKADVLENFMNEVTGKHRAIEILQELVRRKLAKISKKPSAMPFILKKNISSTNTNNKIKNQDKNNSNWNVTPFPDLEKYCQSIDKVVRGTADRDMLRMNRRKRQKELREERRRLNLDSGTTTSSNNAENSGGLDLQLVPIESFPTEEIEDVNSNKTPAATTTNISTRTPTINIEFTSDDDSLSLSSSDLTIENFVQSGNSEPQDLQNEMRNVLQALFGEIRQIPQIGNFSTRNRHNNSGNDLRSSRTASH